MCAREIHRSFLTATTLAIIALLAVPAVAQQTLYNNGADGDVGYYHVNFGSAVTNSFELSQAATITSVILTLYDVDDRNIPQHLKWTITTEPFGGDVKGSGFVGLNRLRAALPYEISILRLADELFRSQSRASTGDLLSPDSGCGHAVGHLGILGSIRGWQRRGILRSHWRKWSGHDLACGLRNLRALR